MVPPGSYADPKTPQIYLSTTIFHRDINISMAQTTSPITYSTLRAVTAVSAVALDICIAGNITSA